jgi:hypothetical protein
VEVDPPITSEATQVQTSPIKPYEQDLQRGQTTSVTTDPEDSNAQNLGPQHIYEAILKQEKKYAEALADL